MNICRKIYQNVNHGFSVEVTTCNKRVATTRNLETGEIVEFNRSKFEWMIKKGIFTEVAA